MEVLIGSGILVILLVIYYIKYTKEYNEEFLESPNGDLVPKERMLKESNANRNIGIIVFFFIWFVITISISYLLYIYSKKYYSDLGYVLVPKGVYIYYMVAVIFPSLFIVSNIFETIRNKFPLEFTRVDY